MKKIIVVGLVVMATAAGATALYFPQLIESVGSGEAAPKTARLSKDFGAYVLNVSDGKTMAISVNNELFNLRVKDIVLPTDSALALEAELALRTLVFGRNILVENSKLAKDGVYEGDVRVGPDHVAAAQVAAGLASAVSGNAELTPLQEAAKQAKIGMWAAPEAASVPESNTPLLEADVRRTPLTH